MARSERNGIIKVSEGVVQKVAVEAGSSPFTFLWDSTVKVAETNPHLFLSVIGQAALKYGLDAVETKGRFMGLAMLHRSFQLQAEADGKQMPRVRKSTADLYDTEFKKIHIEAFQGKNPQIRKRGMDAINALGTTPEQAMKKENSALGEIFSTVQTQTLVGALQAYDFFSREIQPFDPSAEVRLTQKGELPPVTSSITAEAFAKMVVNKQRFLDDALSLADPNRTLLNDIFIEAGLRYPVGDFRQFGSYTAFCITKAFEKAGLTPPLLSREGYGATYGDLFQLVIRDSNAAVTQVWRDFEDLSAELMKLHPSLHETFNVLLRASVPLDSLNHSIRSEAAVISFTEVYRGYRNQTQTDQLNKLLD